MKTKTGMSIGLALTLMVGVFATMLALGLFTPNEARADRPATMEITVGTEAAVALGSLDHPENTAVVGTISVEHDFAAANHNGTAPLTWTVTGDDAELFELEPTTGEEVVLSFKNAPDFENPFDDADGTDRGDNDYGVGVSVTHTDDEGVAQTGNTDTGTLAITVTNVESGVSDVSVVHSPDGTGDNAKVTVAFGIESPLEANVGTITIDFDKDVGVPASISESDVTIRGVIDVPNTDTVRSGKSFTGTPLDVTVSYETIDKEPRVVLTLGDMDPTDDGVTGIAAGRVSVIFRQGAGITNPTEAQTARLYVSTSEDGGVDARVRSDSGDSLTVYRTISLNSKSGTRGKVVTATGAGYKDGTTATVWLDNNPQMNMDGEVFDAEEEGQVKDPTTGPGVKESDEPVLCFADVAKPSDTFSCSFTVNVPPFKTKNTINAFHGRGADGTAQAADEGAPWDLSPQVVPDSSGAAIGEIVSVELKDFPAGEAHVLHLGRRTDHGQPGSAPTSATYHRYK